MVLVDTSVWIGHYRKPNERLLWLLEESLIYSHPIVIGELALGGLPGGRAMLESFAELLSPVVASHEETLTMIFGHDLDGSGIGYSDAQILASTLLTRQAVLWTHDLRLAAAADRMGIALPEGT